MNKMKQKLNTKIDDKIVYLIIAVVIVVALVLVFSGLRKSRNTEVVVEENTVNTEEVSKDTAKTPTKKPSSNTARLSYTDTVKKYGTSRVQFGANCQATPANITYKNGSVIMLDNRSNSARSINIDGKVYKIPAYDYAIATLYSNTLPKTVLVDCGGQPNVLTILIQK